MSFREINRLTWLTITGRKRVTALLMVILTLLSLFVSATMIAFGTIEATEALTRAEQYGRWQVMLYAAKRDDLDRLSDVGGCFATAEFLSDESDIGIVAAAEDDWLDYASVELAEGRFAENAGEITLVRSQKTEGCSVGDKITVKHSLYHVRNIEDSDKDASIESMYEPYLKYVEFPDDLSKYEKWWNENRETYAMWGEKYDHDFAELDADARKIAAFYAYINDLDQYRKGGVTVLYPSTAYSKKLLSHNGKRIAINYSASQLTLNGEWFGENRGKVFEDGKSCEKIEIYAEYTVCGIVEPYAGAWDSDMFDLPSAFVSASEAEDMRAAIELASAEDPTLPERERQFITLGYSPDMSAAKLYDRVGRIYADIRQDTYGMQFGSSDGFITGYVYGADERTGELRYESLSGRGTYTNVILASSRMAKYFIMDDLRAGRVRIEGMLPVEQELTAESAYINQTGRDIRLNTYTYPSGGSNYASLQNFLLASIFMIAFCTLLIAFMTQMKYRMRRERILFALGANRSDILKMNAMEGVCYTLIPLPIGFGLGVLAAIAIIRSTVGEDAVLTIRALSILLALIGCAAVVYLNMIFMSVVGRWLERRRSKIRVRESGEKSRISLRGAVSRFTGSQLTLGVTAVLSVVACAVFLLLLLICGARADYAEQVELVSKPDYVLSSPFGMTEPFADEAAKRLAELDGVAEVSGFIAAEDIYLSVTDAMDSPIVSDRYSKLGGSSKFKEFGGDIGYRTDLYSFVSGVPEDMRERLERAAGVSIDWDAVESGHACVMILPRHIERGGELRLSTRARDAYFGDVDDSFAVGDTLKLYADNVSSGSDGAMAKSTTETELEIAAIVSGFAERGVYPFSTEEDIVLIGGNSAIKRLYTSVGVRVRTVTEASSMITRAKVFYGSALGTTNFYLTTDDSSTIETERAITAIAQDVGSTMLSYRSQNNDLRNRTEMSVLMFGMLAAAILLMMLIIYRYVVGSMIESRHREIGILKALGASDGGIIGGYLTLAAKLHLLALAIGNAAFFGAVLLVEYLLFGGGHAFFEYAARFVFGEYPWAIHIGVCTAILAVGSIFYVISARGVCGQSISDNIRTKE